LTLFYCDHHEIPLPPEHRFPRDKYKLVREALQAEAGFAFFPAPLAAVAEIERTHEASYVAAFLEGRLDAAAIRRIGFPWSPALVTRTLASVGGTLAAARLAWRQGDFTGTLAGGTHHAFYAEGSGYCIFNDICVAINSLRAESGLGRAAVIDLDVHQGDGTAALMSGDPLTMTFSAHGRHNFPFRKQQSKIDMEFENGTGDEEYLAAVAAGLPRVFAFEPEIVFYQAGVDPLAEDTLGKLSLTPDGLRRRDELVLGECARRAMPTVITLGGGYARPIETTVAAHASVFRTALREMVNRRPGVGD
jgi:acetoin utilization deacetylase AcuC-like enzyme